MDNLMVNPSSPEEPEHAICNLLPYGFFHGLCYPRRLMDYFNKSVLFKGNEGMKIRNRWEKTYLSIIKACTYGNKGRQLIIKNPPDTARIPNILNIFPNAKFIFIYRNPYVMFPSIKKFYTSYITDWTLYDYSFDSLDDSIFSIFSQMIDKYLEDRDTVPIGNLVELKFEEFESDPIKELENIYYQLGINGFEQARVNFESYIISQKNYKKNVYSLNKELIQRIDQEWGKYISNWGFKSM
jgi:hypothetical protein